MNGRSWKMSDLDAIAQIERECFSDPWSRRMLADSFLSDKFYGVLLEEDGAIVAYGGVRVILDEAEIQLVAVSEMYRRCGRGRKILQDLLEIAAEKGVRRVFLEVRVSNASAQILYLKSGFTGLYCRTRYYPDGEDAIVMMRELA